MANNAQKIGWIGMGRMGFPMAERLLKAGYDLSIWNRTRAKAEPLAAKGGKVVDRLADLAGLDVVFSIVSTGKDLEEIYLRQGRGGERRQGPACPRSWSTAPPSRSRNRPRSASACARSAATSWPRRSAAMPR